MRQRAIRPGEAVAMYEAALERGPKSFFWLWSAPMPINERAGDSEQFAVVNVRGPLEHHLDSQGDSYDAIVQRVTEAFAGICTDENGEQEDEGVPEAVILRIDSPGGVVSGLNECVKKLRALSAAAEIPLIAYVDEMAASAAYALACSCDEVYLPKSAIAGSIGVISTMVDQSALDKAMGLRFVTITSGARKADGHPHVPISSDAVAAERGRVDKLAGQFYRIVQQARGLSPKAVQSYQAGIFLGDEAVKAGLADGVMSWDAFIGALSDGASAGGAGKTSHGSTNSQSGASRPGANMLKLKALIEKQKAAIAAEKDRNKLTALRATLASYEQTLAALKPSAKSKHVIEHKEVHTDDGKGAPPDDGDDGDDKGDDADEEDEEEEEEAGGNETDRSDDESGDEEDEGDEEEEEAAAAMSEEDEEEAAAKKSAKALLASVKDPAARGALQSVMAKAAKFDALGARLAKIEADAKATQKATAISDALTKRRITPSEAKQLGGKKLAFVKAFLSMRPKAIVHTSPDELAVPPGGKGGPAAKAGLNAQEYAMIEQAHFASDGKVPLAKFIENYQADKRASSNGAGSGSY